MKNCLLFTFMFLTLSSYSKTQTEGDSTKHELKLNLFSFATNSYIEINYEYILGGEFTSGVALSYWDYSYDIGYMFMPYARFYPGWQTTGTGIFTELSLPLFSDLISTCSSRPCESWVEPNLALGVAAGYKLISKKRFIMELYLGAMSRFLNRPGDGVVPRIGISFGKSF